MSAPSNPFRPGGASLDPEGPVGIEATLITEMAVEGFVYLVQDTDTLPATIGTIAGLPGGVTTDCIRGEVVPGVTEAQFAEDAIEGGAWIGRGTTAAVRGGGRDERLD